MFNRLVSNVHIDIAGNRTHVAILALMLVASPLTAQGKRSGPDDTRIRAEGAFAAIVVSDLDTSLNWYESSLGMHVIKRGRSPRAAATTVVLAGNNLFVEIIHYDTPAPARAPIDDTHALAPGILKVGIVLGQQDFDLLVRRLHGQVFADNEMHVRSFLIKDPEGNLLQFFTKMK